MNYEKKLKGKVCIITGAARGIGATFAERLAKDGATIVAVDILDSSETIEKVQALGSIGFSSITDITSEEAIKVLATTVKEKFGGAHILINNAGLHPHPTPLEDITFAYWKKTFAVNLDGMFLTIQAFLPFMKENNWGRIINIGSSSANAAPPNGAPYVASKTAVIGLTRAVATEVGKYNITVNAVAPNPVRTPGLDMKEEEIKLVASMQSIPKIMMPPDVAGIIAFLCSNESNFITGQHLHVDGGMIKGD